MSGYKPAYYVGSLSFRLDLRTHRQEAVHSCVFDPGQEPSTGEIIDLSQGTYSFLLLNANLKNNSDLCLCACVLYFMLFLRTVVVFYFIIKKFVQCILVIQWILYNVF